MVAVALFSIVYMASKSPLGRVLVAGFHRGGGFQPRALFRSAPVSPGFELAGEGSDLSPRSLAVPDEQSAVLSKVPPPGNSCKFSLTILTGIA